jgi:hypothetical protein
MDEGTEILVMTEQLYTKVTDKTRGGGKRETVDEENMTKGTGIMSDKGMKIRSGRWRRNDNFHPPSSTLLQRINTGFYNKFVFERSVLSVRSLSSGTPVAHAMKFSQSSTAASEHVSKRNGAVCIAEHWRHVTLTYTCKLQLVLLH